MVDFSLNKRYLKVEEIIIDLKKKEEKKIISWQNALGITSILGIVGLINIFQENKVNFRKKPLPISNSLSMIELISQKATQTTPMIIYDNENK